MSRFSVWYQSAVKRIAVAEEGKVRLARKHAEEQRQEQQRAAKRKVQYQQIDAQMKELRKPTPRDDTPPWEKE